MTSPSFKELDRSDTNSIRTAKGRNLWTRLRQLPSLKILDLHLDLHESGGLPESRVVHMLRDLSKNMKPVVVQAQPGHDRSKDTLGI
jgi:hypothetical protein